MPSMDAYHEFLSHRRADLRRVANTTRREAELKDVEQEAWIAATVYEARWGRSFDFRVDSNQELVIGYLFNEFVKFAEKTNRYAESIAQDEEADCNASCINRLSFALSNADPQVALQDHEEDMQVRLAKAQRLSYSEAIAYAVLLVRFNSDMSKLAGFLRVVVPTLRQRVDRSVCLMQVQPTLFDGIEIIDTEFIAKPEKNHKGKSDPVPVGQEPLELTFFNNRELPRLIEERNSVVLGEHQHW